MLINISLFNQSEKCLVFSNNNNINLNNLKLKTLKLNELVSYSSIIQTDEEEKLFVKVTRSKYGANNNGDRKHNKWKFFFREIIAERILLTARTLQEYRSTKKLIKIGIKTPDIYASGFFITNMNTYNGIIIYKKMENLISAQEFLLTSQSIEMKTILLKKIEIDYKLMAIHKIHFRDLHMSNILFNPVSHDIYWIDASLYRISLF